MESGEVLGIAAIAAESPQPRARVMHSIAEADEGRPRNADAEPWTGRGLVAESATMLVGALKFGS